MYLLLNVDSQMEIQCGKIKQGCNKILIVKRIGTAPQGLVLGTKKASKCMLTK